jgi:hypothetical protein
VPLVAARDEVRHARVTAAIAGVPVRRPRVRTLPLRSLAAIARDNAVEGCVHETWAAAVAHLEPHPAYRSIARDEVDHAQLAWDIDAWLGERARPDLRRRAAARLVARVSVRHVPLARRLSTLLWT